MKYISLSICLLFCCDINILLTSLNDQRDIVQSIVEFKHVLTFNYQTLTVAFLHSERYIVKL